MAERFSDELVRRLARARHVGVLTGAGISAESGIPTFRDPGPAAGLPQLAGDHGAYIVEINIEPSAVSHMLDEVLLGPAGVILPQLVAAVQAERRNISTLER